MRVFGFILSHSCWKLIVIPCKLLTLKKYYWHCKSMSPGNGKFKLNSINHTERVGLVGPVLEEKFVQKTIIILDDEIFQGQILILK